MCVMKFSGIVISDTFDIISSCLKVGSDNFLLNWRTSQLLCVKVTFWKQCTIIFSLLSADSEHCYMLFLCTCCSAIWIPAHCWESISEGGRKRSKCNNGLQCHWKSRSNSYVVKGLHSGWRDRPKINHPSDRY